VEHVCRQTPFSTHFDGKRYFNPGGAQVRGFWDLLRWQFTGRRATSPRFISDVQQSRPPSRVDGGELRVTLVNHSTVLLQQGGLHILTDPIWSERASPVSWMGPRRRRQPGVRLQDLPRIDVVLLSHNHYDHLDLATLRELAERGPCEFVVPARMGQLLRSRNIGPVHELDWGEAASIAGATVHAVPAVHFSARGLFDRNRTLWCGYVSEAAGRVIYFAGDTGFGDHFAAIRERFGAPRLALLPIGAYEPRWFMSPVHMSPDDAVRAHEILGAKTSVAIHHGTFQLADEGIDEPKERLKESGVGDSFLVLDNGQSVTLT
jgi:L-ascorbate metabolism protein UlaG (beta-lactamase superfamily)